MKNYPNIEKSVFRKGGYVGYANGNVYLINKSKSSFGNWCARNRENPNDYIFAFGLQSLSDKLQQKG